MHPRRRATAHFANFSEETLAPFSLSQVSSPTEEELGASPDLTNFVPPWCLKHLEGDQEWMLRGVDEHERIARDAPAEPHTDHILRGNYRQHLRLIKKLDRLHMLKTRGHLFAYYKNSKIRVILDARRTNQMLCQPPRVALATAETFSRIEVRLPNGVMARSTEATRSFEESVARLATVDVDNCLHCPRIGQSLAE